MPSLQSIARALGGDVVNARNGQIRCPGPRHSKRDRSLSVWLSSTSIADFTVHSYCGDDPLECKDDVRRRLGREAFGDDKRPVGRPTKSGEENLYNIQDKAPVGNTAAAGLRKLHAKDSNEEAAKIERPRQIWREGCDPRGTIVETYLKSRGLTLPDEVAGEAIRYHERCPWRDEAAGRTIFVPVMLGAMRSIATEEITGVHRTRLTADGQKVDRRMLGKASGAAIMLASFDAVGASLTIGEGIETCLAAWSLGWSNVWALGSVGAIASFPLLAGISALTLLVETDDSGASAKAIDAAGNRYADAGREVTLITPTIAGDLNDVVQRGATA